jgi:hypothetical protein
MMTSRVFVRCGGGSFLVAAGLLFAQGCDARNSGGGGEAIATEVGYLVGETSTEEQHSEEQDGGCAFLGPETCQSTKYCVPLFSGPLKADCSSAGEVQYAGCWTGSAIVDGELVDYGCETMVTWAHRPGDSDTWWVFADSCVPDGWTISESWPECENL